MDAIAEAMEQRMTALENRVSVMQQHLDQLVPVPHTPASTPRLWNIPWCREAYAQQTEIDAVAEEVFRKMGIPDEPPLSFEEYTKLRNSMPMGPETEWASRELMRMREE